MVFSDGKVPFVYNTIRKNGHATENTYVYLLSHEDGKQQIVKATKNLCKDAKRKPEILNHFHAQHFEYYLKDVLDIPDPELIFHFGKTLGLIGYLPWHIRLSEILSYPTHHNITIEEFQKLLQRYSKCEQRFGK
ncbi:dehydrodolichyl diphosphate synthase complex subunit nus1-like [Stegodyphus dumicola]|uniref:dehydrodolichyl diphosphate synthase complex subunit nus1-like n=1 Tax=Stegodyphus dumicola TaxID=202533 RepID=UPI0015AB84D0|nr:dehydrodolichyl diphosphate synthase complex subunit nus1-like [Stegodyphus dumicola]